MILHDMKHADEVNGEMTSQQADIIYTNHLDSLLQNLLAGSKHSYGHVMVAIRTKVVLLGKKT